MNLPRHTKVAAWSIFAVAVVLFVATMVDGQPGLALSFWLIAVLCLLLAAA